MQRNDLILIRSLALCFAVCSSAALAQSFPNKPVRVVVPYAAGGIIDATARTVSAKLAEIWSQSVVVENLPGVAGVRGTEVVVRAAADGHTLGVGASGIHTTNKLLLSKLPYDQDKDITPIVLLVRNPAFLIVNPAVPATTLGQFIAHAKANPGKLAYGSAGPGSPQHMAMELFKLRAGVDLLHVPYKGAAAFVTDLIGGQIHAVIDSTALQQVRAGKLRAIAVVAHERYRGAPDLPSFAESGMPGVEITGWFTLFGPANLPSAIVAKINADANTALVAPEVQKRLLDWHAVPAGGSTADLLAFIRAQTAEMAEVIQRANIKAE